jgi:acyl-CoA synthetase (AMP-forming)/AMP-acid ligase II
LLVVRESVSLAAVAFNLADLVEHAVDVVPERTALICADRRITYTELEDRANRLAHHLAASGVRERQHVGVFGYNCIEYVETMLACFKIRAVPINVNYRYVEDELLYLFDNADLVACVFQARFGLLVDRVHDRLPLLEHLIAIEDGSGTRLPPGAVAYEEALAGASPERDFGPRSDDDLYVLYTGGTTGMPKGVMWHQADVFRALGGGIDFRTGIPITDEHELSREGAAAAPSTSLVLAPLMHGAAQWGTLGNLFKAGTAVLLERFDPHAVWAAIDEHQIAGIGITGDAMAIPLIDAYVDGDHDGSSLVVLASTAAVFSPVVKERLFALFPDLLVTEAVGSSESGFNGARMLQKDAAPDDRGLINVTRGPDTIVIDEDDRPVEPGQVGRMARGGQVPLGYYKDRVKTAATFIEVDGTRWSVPGDFARLELDGSMTLLGRGNQCINSGGEKIYPEEVESAIKAHPAVYDALVVGLPDERWGQRVAAVIQARPDVEAPSLDELADHCRERLAGYKVPRALLVVDEVPRQPSAKPDYARATALAEEADL